MAEKVTIIETPNSSTLAKNQLTFVAVTVISNSSPLAAYGLTDPVAIKYEFS